MDNTFRKAFAQNLKNARKQKNLTQEEFAEKISYSVKAVSKWECAIALPPTETLITIAEVLNTKIDKLLQINHAPSYFLGIDGGATKTCFLLADSYGKIINRVVKSSSNPIDIGFEKSTEVLEEGIREVTKGIPRSDISAFAGISGGTTGNMKEKLKAFFEKFGFAKFDNGSDIENVIYAGLNDKDGLALIIGTGSSGVVKKGNELIKLGGLGYLFDHGGSGYDLGCQAIRAICRAEDLTGKPTILHQLILEKIQSTSARDSIGYFYQIGKKGIASFSPLVIDAYKQGDEVAKEILTKNMRHVAELILASRKHLNTTSPINVVMVGGLTEEGNLIIHLIQDCLDEFDGKENYNLSIYHGDVAYGALIRAGMNPNKNSY